MATALPLVVVEKVPSKSTSAVGSSPKTYTYTSIEGTQSKLLLAQSRYYNGSSTLQTQPDVFKPTSSRYVGARMRPLGLLPDRKADGAWKELSMLYDAQKTQPSKQQHQASLHQDTELTLKNKPIANVEESNYANKEVISATVMPKSMLSEDKSTMYRLRTTKSSERERQMDDIEYLDTLAQVDMQTYDNYWQDKAAVSLLPNEQRQGQNHYQERKSARMQRIFRSYTSRPNMEYLSFSGQAYLNKRFQMLDCRDPLGQEPCERCRIRGSRCPTCIAIRTGGGYIILDSGASQSRVLNPYQRDGWNNGGSSRLWSSERKRRPLNRSEQDSFYQLSDQNLSEFEDTSGDHRKSTGDGYGSHNKHSGSGWKGESWDGAADAKRRLGSTMQQHARHTEGSYDREMRTGSRLGDHSSSAFKRSGVLGNKDDNDDYDSNTRQRTQRRHDTDGSNEDYTSGTAGNQAGHNSSTSISQSRLLKEGIGGRKSHGSGAGDSASTFRSSQDKQSRAHNKKRRKLDGESSDSDDDHDAIKKRSKNAKVKEHGTGEVEDATGNRHDRKFNYGRSQRNDDEPKRPFTGSLMKFKSKRDDLKAKQCTLKELHNIIDPLDYLAKYCIIDQTKVPHYQRVFENVDRDEDDEIDIAELDFALKAVNYNLISDTELTYVNSILEIAGRYALNFQLFTLVAALSEKVVALDDMVKRLINDMDFEALETKMKKCKELFYLLASDEAGVVTTDALAVELQAGGLTQEHVEFVVDRLNNDDKGIVEFLDYLTYVPLFVEIHGNINDNPLDFTRHR